MVRWLVGPQAPVLGAAVLHAKCPIVRGLCSQSSRRVAATRQFRVKYLQRANGMLCPEAFPTTCTRLSKNSISQANREHTPHCVCPALAAINFQLTIPHQRLVHVNNSLASISSTATSSPHTWASRVQKLLDDSTTPPEKKLASAITKYTPPPCRTTP